MPRTVRDDPVQTGLCGHSHKIEEEEKCERPSEHGGGAPINNGLLV